MSRSYPTMLYMPGTAGNGVSAPNSIGLSITGDIDIIARVSPISWRLGSNRVIVSKYDAATSARSWQFQLLSTGVLRLTVSVAGTTGVDADASVALTQQTAGRWHRVTWRQSDGRVQFFQSEDDNPVPTAWTQVGTDRTAAVASLFASTQPIRVGSSTTGTGFWPGGIYRVIVKNGIDGAPLFDADFTKQITGAISFTEDSANASMVTITQSGGDTARLVGRSFLA
jgi:hypothetical protein